MHGSIISLRGEIWTNEITLVPATFLSACTEPDR